MTSHPVPSGRSAGLGLLVVAGVLLSLLAVPSSADAALVYAKGASDTSAVWIANDDGSGARRLVEGANPRIAPDGKAVAFTPNPSDANPELRVVPAAGGPSRSLLRPWRSDMLAWSPDGRFIAALTGTETGKQRLVLIEVASGRSRVIATGYFFESSFSPASDRLVYSRSRRAGSGSMPRADLYVTAVSGGAAERITRDGRSLNPVWGPQQITFARQTRPPRRGDAPKSDLWLVSPDGDQRRRLTRDRPRGRFLSGLFPTAWSQNGQRLIAQFGGQDTSWLVTVDPASGRQRALGPQGEGRTGYQGVKLSRDGSTILATSGGPEDNPSVDVIAVPYDGGAPQVLARDAFGPDWTR
jgi:Tol biopolymer transport system component